MANQDPQVQEGEAQNVGEQAAAQIDTPAATAEEAAEEGAEEGAESSGEEVTMEEYLLYSARCGEIEGI